MKKGFSFESNLPHQIKGVDAIVNLFGGVIKNNNVIKDYKNPILDLTYIKENVLKVQETNNLPIKYVNDNIFDIQMETGTGKTYTYTKTIFELNRNLNLNKFILVVPTLSIKAGTLNFLNSDGTKEHFRLDYGREIKIHVVESQKGNKGLKEYIPSAISDFVKSPNNNIINILLINSGMVNSDTLTKLFDVNLFDDYDTPLKGIQSVNAITIIDEPHKFPPGKKTFDNILKFESQVIIRYGATFKNQFINKVYELNARDAFNQDLVKGIRIYVNEFQEGNKTTIKLIEITKTNITFVKTVNKKDEIKSLTKGDALSLIDDNIFNIFVESFITTKVLLSNGIELKVGDKINPYTFNQKFTNIMLEDSVKKHFELEKDYMNRNVKIKPLTLFFIDDIDSYRLDNNDNGEMANYLEKLIKKEIKNSLKDKKITKYYKEYLESSLKDLRSTHGGYFSKDNTGKDDKVEKEIKEILHDKESLLDINNTRRFIFSKWTLKEGWDNPNVFQICKLRSSGSETSKIQEVGRGLRIPVNQYMQRIKDEDFELHYRVDFTESDFAAKLINEINKEIIEELNIVVGKKINDSLLQRLINITGKSLMIQKNELFDYKIIDDNEILLEGSEEKLKQYYPELFVKKDKISESKKSDKEKFKIKVRKENYDKLKTLWEEINKKVILEYKFDGEDQVKDILIDMLSVSDLSLKQSVESAEYIVNKKSLDFLNKKRTLNHRENINTLTYGNFIIELSKVISVNINTLNGAFIELKMKDIFDINKRLNYETIKELKELHNLYLINNFDTKFSINYKETKNRIHPTKFTDDHGNLISVDSSYLGTGFLKEQKAQDSYLFEEIYYDSELEKQNILEQIDEVVVFTKIPKSSIKIPIVGGGTYSPDFAYVIKTKTGKQELNLVVETKGKKEEDLSKLESLKIKQTEKLFELVDMNVKFRKQLSKDMMFNIIDDIKNRDE